MLNYKIIYQDIKNLANNKYLSYDLLSTKEILLLQTIIFTETQIRYTKIALRFDENVSNDKKYIMNPIKVTFLY